MNRYLCALGFFVLAASPSFADSYADYVTRLPTLPLPTQPNDNVATIRNGIGYKVGVPTLASGLPVGYLNAVTYGVVANGVTSDDVALTAAVAACSAVGGTLLLPAGEILLTGAAQITLNHCRMVGQGPAPSGGAPRGTTILLTSTSVVPFILGDGGIVLEGINFYWPNQATGTTAYPALMTATENGVASMIWNGITIVNAYDGFVTSATSGGIGRFLVSNSYLYALHDLFKIGSVGDMILISNTVFNYGPWGDMTNFSTAFKTMVTAAASSNKILRCTTITTSAGCVIQISNSSAFGWGFGVYLDAAGKIDEGSFDMLWDGVGTILDSTTGGTVANTTFTCRAGCLSGIVDAVGGVSQTGNNTAFNLGANGSVKLDNFNMNSAAGSVVVSAGSNVSVDGGSLAFGAANDGGDYYAVRLTAGASSHLDIRNVLLSGIPASTKHHGVKTVANSGFQVQNTRSINLNDTLDAVLSTGNNLFNGNTSESTTGTAAIITSGTGSLSYAANRLDKPPAPAVSACGAGASLAGNILHGFISVGSTNPTTSCTMTMPFLLTSSGGGDCIFGLPGPGITIGGGPAGSPPVWTITTSATVHGSQIFYRCSSDR